MRELAPYAMTEAQSGGRRHPEPPHPYRTEYQRDRDRIIHSRAFRRLEAKTQVFTQRFSDHFRNRLTHTLEVSQIARTIGGVLGLNVDLCEALALAHDIGHPPFGHAGEHCLDELMRARGDSFDHNLHALRIVESFEQRYADFPGLNLTFEVREGLIKHSRDYDPARFPELAEYRLAERPPLEAQLIDLADEIAYNTADLDDGFEARLLDLETLLAAVPLFRDAFNQVTSHPSTDAQGAPSRVEGQNAQAARKLQFNEALRRVIDRLASDLIENTGRLLVAERMQTVEDVRKYPRRLLGFSPEVAEANAQLKHFLYEKLYAHPKLIAEREQAVKVLEELFRFYLEHSDRLPRFYFEKTHTEPAHRVICDYIAGMTDTYLFRQHHEVLQPTRAPAD